MLSHHLMMGQHYFGMKGSPYFWCIYYRKKMIYNLLLAFLKLISKFVPIRTDNIIPGISSRPEGKYFLLADESIYKLKIIE